MATGPSYLSVQSLKLRLGLTDATWDQTLSEILTGLEATAETFVGFPLAYTTVTEYLTTQGEEGVFLTRSPVDSVASVYENARGFGQAANFTSDNLLTVGTDYLVEIVPPNNAAKLVRLNGARWPYTYGRGINSLASTVAPTRQSVQVTYASGFRNGAPADVYDAAYLEAAILWRMRGGVLGPAQSESADGVSLSYVNLMQQMAKAGQGTGPFLTALLYERLKRYRRIPLGRSP